MIISNNDDRYTDHRQLSRVVSLGEWSARPSLSCPLRLSFDNKNGKFTWKIQLLFLLARFIY